MLIKFCLSWRIKHLMKETRTKTSIRYAKENDIERERKVEGEIQRWRER